MPKSSIAPRNKGAPTTLAKRWFTRNRPEKREASQGPLPTTTTAERSHGLRQEDPSPFDAPSDHHHASNDAVHDDEGFVHVTRGGAKSMAAQQKKDTLQDARNAVDEVLSITKGQRRHEDWTRLNDANKIIRDHENQKRRIKASETRQNRSLASSIRVGRNGSILGRQTRMNGITPDQQQIGVVTYHKGGHRIEVDNNNFMCQNDKTIEKDFNGIWWQVKPRFWIIVAHHYDEVVEVPVLSYDNNGLKYIPQGKHCEYLNLQPLDAPNQNKWEKQSQSMPTLKIGRNKGDRKIDRLTSVVHFTAVSRRPVHCAELEICGILDTESMRILDHHCKNAIGRKHRDNEDAAISALEK